MTGNINTSPNDEKVAPTPRSINTVPDAKTETYNDYEKNRLKAAKAPSNAPPSEEAKGSDAPGEETKTTPTPAEKTGGSSNAPQDGGNDPNTSNQDGAADDLKEGDLPQGIKDRINRANKKTKNLALANKQKDAKIAELEAKLNNKVEDKTETKEKAPADTGKDDENFPDYPEDADYDMTTKLGRDSFNKDIAAWHDETELTGGKHANKKTETKPVDTKPKDDAKPDEKAADSEPKPISNLLNSYYSLLDTDSADDHLSDKFSDLVKEGKIHGSTVMLDWLIESDTDLLVGKAFVETPKLSRVMTEKPVATHVDEMNSLLKTLKEKATTTPKAKEEETKGRKFRNVNTGVPIVQPLEGIGRSTDSNDLANLDPADYQNRRLAQEQKSRR